MGRTPFCWVAEQRAFSLAEWEERHSAGWLNKERSAWQNGKNAILLGG